MGTQTVAETAVTIMRQEAALIVEHGWNGAGAVDHSPRRARFGLNITTSALWAVAGRPCAVDDLTPAELDRYADFLDIVEHALGMSAAEYEQAHAADRTMDVVWFLEEAAWNLEQALA